MRVPPLFAMRLFKLSLLDFPEVTFEATFIIIDFEQFNTNQVKPKKPHHISIKKVIRTKSRGVISCFL